MFTSFLFFVNVVRFLLGSEEKGERGETARRTFRALMIPFLCDGLIAGMYGSYAVYVLKKAYPSSDMLIAAAPMFTVVPFMLSFPAGYFSAGRSKKPLFRLAATLYAAAGLGYLFVPAGPFFLPLFTLFGVAEAMRTGSHKAIMLDWARSRDNGISATRLIGRTRFFSKASAGFAALAGGAILWITGSFTPLFWAATLPAAAGILLMLSYPSELEGEQRRSPRERLAPRQAWRRLWRGGGMGALILASLLFESQVKLAQHYLQPFLKADLHRHDIALVGGIGALLVGLYYLGQDLLGGLAAGFSARLESLLGGADLALRRLLLALTAVSAAMVAAFSLNWITAGIAGYLLIAVLQNLRRPVFVARLDRVMDPAQRATTLSLESQGRSWAVALLSPPMGYVADHWGLAAAFAAISAMLVVAFPLQVAAECRAREGGIKGNPGAG